MQAEERIAERIDANIMDVTIDELEVSTKASLCKEVIQCN
jgi:hypothetical protein